MSSRSLAEATDDSARSSQTFVVEVTTRRNGDERRVSGQGRDICAITAPIAVEAVERILDDRAQPVGVVAPGETLDPEDFLRTLPLENLALKAPQP